MRYRRIGRSWAMALGVLAYGVPHVAASQTLDEPVIASDEEDELERLRSEVVELRQREAEARERVSALEARLERLEEVLSADVLDYDDLLTVRGRYVPRQDRASPSDPAFAGLLQDGWIPGERMNQIEEDEPVISREVAAAPEEAVSGEGDRKTPAPTDAAEDVTEQRQGRFGSSIGLEVALGYSHFDNARINLDGFLALDSIFLGTISIDEVTADIFTVDPSLRLGVTDQLAFDVHAPVLYRTSTYRSGGAGGSASALVEETVDGSGLGDVSIGASYRIQRETAGWPDIVVNGRVKLPTGRHPFGIEFVEVANSEGNLMVPDRLATGSGVYGASIGVSVLKTLDPMIVFGDVTYFRNFERSFIDIDENPEDQPGSVDVGDSIQFGAGLAFALNDRSSISMSYTQRIVGKTWLTPEDEDPRVVIGSDANIALVNLGATFTLGERVSLVTNVGIGLTDDSPDMSLSVRLPFRF